MIDAPLTPSGDPIRPTQGDIGGPRHYEGPTLGTLAAWKCPACAVENTTPFEDGCPSCGAGSAKPRHVGVPPRADARSKVPIVVLPDTPGMVEERTENVGFNQWLHPRRGIYSPEVEALFYEAWQAAIRWYQTSVSNELHGQPTLDTPNDRIPVPKALLVRVLSILESTTDLPDEQQSPELLAVIAELKELLEP